MRSGRLFPLVLLLLACGREPLTPPRRAVPAAALPRVGTIGDAPLNPIEVGLAATGRISTASGDVDLDGLAAHLADECMGHRDPAGNSTRDVVFRVHASLPWEVVLWALDLLEWRNVHAYRVHFAVRQEEGEEEGTMAVFLSQLPPQDAEPDPAARRTFRVRLREDGAAVESGKAFAAYREILSQDPDAVAEVSVRPGIASGHVLQTVDLLLRAGAKRVAFYCGVLPNRPTGAGSRETRTALEEYVQSHPAHIRGFRVSIHEPYSREAAGSRELIAGGPPAARPPPVARVRGRPAGSIATVFSWRGAAIGGGIRSFWHRGRREDLVALGGSDLTEAAVELGLEWLRDHQDEDGRWDCDDFSKHDSFGDRCGGQGHALHDVGVTGLALLAFLGAGHTGRDDARRGEYARTVRAALNYLIRSQGNDGVFGLRMARDFMYDHAIATLAMCEAFWMTRNPRYKRPAQAGLDFIGRARNPYLAWRYVPRGGDNDTSITAWCVMALKSGKYAGLDVDPDAFEGARQWIDRMTDPDTGRVGYNQQGGPPARPAGMQDRFPAERSQSMTAAGILCRTLLGEEPRTSDGFRKGVALCAARPPAWDDGSIDMCYWYFGTLALFQAGGDAWKAWNEALKAAILPHQHPAGSGALAGSFDPIDPWGGVGGRVYSTALLVLCLEAYYRYGG